ncbi:hypothetical protein RIF29_30148 [Crotalaria pallida]|uniref:C2 domain-containing protein n=1 Tax=Crotalaria pallida TaxID=3830 RepID=A0AAN9I120_CROPI
MRVDICSASSSYGFNTPTQKTGDHRLVRRGPPQLRVDCKPATKNLYVVVRPESIKSYTTAMAEEGNVNPSWNQKFMVDMPMHARCITFEVKCKTSMGVKDVGVARVAASEFLGGVVPDHCLQFLSFRLRDWEGRRNGVLNFTTLEK